MKIAETKLWYFIKPYVPKRFWDDILNIIYWFRCLSYRGAAKECPICNHQHDHFAENSCPRCNSGSRHRALWLYLNRESDLFTRPNTKLLHFAPEYCLHKRIRARKNIDYLSGDLNSTRAMEKINMMDIQYPDNHFDVVISLDVLMHVDDDIAAMKELSRVLNPEGWSIHLVSLEPGLEKTLRSEDIDGKNRLAEFGHFDYKRNYGLDYPDILAANGFKVTVIDVKTFTTAEERIRFHIPDHFKVFVCRKKVAVKRSNKLVN